MIKKMTTKNFRGKSSNLDFCDNINIVRGKNEAGKSTIAEAIAFSYFGTDSMGTKNPDHLISVGHNETEVHLSIRGPRPQDGEIVDKSILSRKKKRGDTSQIKIQVVGGTPVRLTQTELSNQMGISLEAFTSCWHAGYFMNLPDAKKIAILGELAGLDRRELLKSILPPDVLVPEQLALKNCKNDTEIVATKRRQMQNQCSNEEGQITQLQNKIAGAENLPDVNPAELQQKINKLNAHVAEFDLYNKIQAKYMSDMNAYSILKKQSVDAKDRHEKFVHQLNLAQQNKVTMTAELKNVLEDETKLREQVPQLEAKIKQTPAMPMSVSVPKEDVCPTCRQGISESHRVHVKNEYDKILIAYNTEAREVADHNKSILSQLSDLQTQIQSKSIKAVSLKAEIKNLENSIFNLTKGIEDTKKQLNQNIVEPVAPQKPEGDEEILRSELLSAMADFKSYSQSISVTEEAKSQIEYLKMSVNTQKENIRKFSILEEALKKLPQYETLQTIKGIEIENCKVELMDGALNLSAKYQMGDEEIYVPYFSLSAGKKMRIDIAVCESLKKAAQLSSKPAPRWIFIDNADLIDQIQDVLPRGVQVIVAKVDVSCEQVVVDHILN